MGRHPPPPTHPPPPHTHSTPAPAAQVGGQLDGAMRLFAEMQEEGLVPNTGVCGGVGWGRADQARPGVLARHLLPVLTARACQTSAHYLTKCSCWAPSRVVTVVVNALLSVCAAVGDADAAVQVYR